MYAWANRSVVVEGRVVLAAQSRSDFDDTRVQPQEMLDMHVANIRFAQHIDQSIELSRESKLEILEAVRRCLLRGARFRPCQLNDSRNCGHEQQN